MFSFPKLSYLCVIVFCLAISGCDKPQTSDDVVETYIQKWVDFYPSRAFSEGVRSAAGQFEDFSENNVTAWVAYNHEVIRILPALLEGVSLDRKIDGQVLLRRVRMELERWEQDRVLYHQPQWYAEIISQALTYLLVSEELTSEEKFEAVLRRLEGIRSLSHLGIKTLNDASPERTSGALRTLDQTAAFFEGNLPGLMRSWVGEGKYERINKTTRDTAAVVRELAVHIRDNILLHATLPDSYGREAYARKLEIRTGEDITPEELAAQALTEVGRTRGMMVAEAQKWWQANHGGQQRPGDDKELLKRAVAAMEDDRVDSNKDFLDQFIDITAKAEQFVIEHDLATVPQPTTLYIALSPDHFSGAAVGGVYQAGPFAPDLNTLFYLPSVPENASDKQREGFYRSFNNHFNAMIISHEMFPGHYLQAKVSVVHASKIRSLFADGTYVEGWGSFSELIMLDAGWSENNHLTRLAHLRKRLENATRAYLSVMVHTAGWDKERLTAFATTKGLLAPQFAINLWRRVINSPLQLPTYFMGFHGFSKLWAAEQARLGKDFSTRDFVDGVLRTGPIPLKALEAVFQQKHAMTEK
ncbi:MAG: hypothetical protein COB49_03790 [Alphaproteobacteria bacterium]|nr:MAG: hypothetical protein COB49_03790 [Alphaproteobacteria bacterium]